MIKDRHRIALGIFIGAVIFYGCLTLRNMMIDGVSSEIQKYHTAVRAEDDAKFNYAIDSKQGKILSSGNFQAKDTVKFDEFDGNYMKMVRVLEEYRPHTYTTCNGKGKCRTHIYYSWDEASREERKANTIIFRGREYSSVKFNFQSFEYRAGEKKIDTAFWELKKRYVFYVVDKSIFGSFYAETNNTGLTDNIIVHNKSLDDLIKSVHDSRLTTEIMAWIILVLNIRYCYLLLLLFHNERRKV